MKKLDFNKKCKIALFIELTLILFGLIIYGFKTSCKADEFDDLKKEITKAEVRLNEAERKLIEINPEMFSFYKINRYYSCTSDIVNFYLKNHAKEYFEYAKALGDLEDLKELYNMAIMNSINSEKK